MAAAAFSAWAAGVESRVCAFRHWFDHWRRRFFPVFAVIDGDRDSGPGSADSGPIYPTGGIASVDSAGGPRLRGGGRGREITGFVRQTALCGGIDRRGGIREDVRPVNIGEVESIGGSPGVPVATHRLQWCGEWYIRRDRQGA
jgi:hypothetical protein